MCNQNVKSLSARDLIAFLDEVKNNFTELGKDQYLLCYECEHDMQRNPAGATKKCVDNLMVWYNNTQKGKHTMRT